MQNGEYPYNLLDFLASSCVPSNKANPVLQIHILESLIGLDIGEWACPSSLIMHTKMQKDGDSM